MSISSRFDSCPVSKWLACKEFAALSNLVNNLRQPFFNLMRQSARTDANQKRIVDALRQIGCSVFPTHAVGKGFPDLVVGYRGVNVLLEIKDGSKPPSKQRLTPDEEAFFADWRGCVRVANSVQQAIDIMAEETI